MLDILKTLTEQELEIAEVAIESMEYGINLILLHDNLLRVVEIHAIGLTSKGNAAMRVFQVYGDTSDGQELGWKLMLLSKCELINMESHAPREGYKTGDKGFTTIFKEL